MTIFDQIMMIFGQKIWISSCNDDLWKMKNFPDNDDVCPDNDNFWPENGDFCRIVTTFDKTMMIFFIVQEELSKIIRLLADLVSRFDLLWIVQDEPDHDNDLLLAKRVSYVHSHSKQLPSRIESLNMNLMFPYINLCKHRNSTIPDELTNYIVRAYV